MLKEYSIAESRVQSRLRQICPLHERYEEIKEVSSTFVDRAQAIEEVFLRDRGATKIKLTGTPDALQSDDMYAVVRGMIQRSREKDYSKIESLDLSNNDITQAGFFTLYTGIVNRGIYSNWGECTETKVNNLSDIRIKLLGNPILQDDVVSQSLLICKQYNVCFLLDGLQGGSSTLPAAEKKEFYPSEDFLKK